MGVVRLLILAVLLTACSEQTEEAITIGGVFHLTGPAAVWGEADHNGVLLAIEEKNAAGGINGKQVQLITEDSATDFPKTVSSHKKLIEQGVLLTIGPTWFGQVASQIADEHKHVMISPSAGTVTEPSPYFFNLWPPEQHEIRALVAFMKQQDVHTVVVLSNTNEWSESMKQHFIVEAEKNGMQIIDEFTTAIDESDFRTIITKLKASDADALYGAFGYYPSQGAFSKQASELGLTMPIYSTSGTENPQLLSEYPTIEGTIYPYPQRTETELAFARKYAARFGKEPGPSAAYAYDAANLAMDSLVQGTDAETIKSYLASLTDYAGVSNTITFDTNGRITQKPHVIKEVRDKQFIIIA